MEVDPWRRVLAFYEPTCWTVQLKSGETLIVYADSVADVEDCHVFELLLHGEPPSLLPILRMPKALVADMHSEIGALAPPER